MHLQCTERRVRHLARRLHEGQQSREQVHDAYGKKDLAPAAQRTRMLELCLGSNSWVLTAATSAPGLRSRLPHLHRDWVHPSHICTRTRRTRAHICTGTCNIEQNTESRSAWQGGGEA